MLELLEPNGKHIAPAVILNNSTFCQILYLRIYYDHKNKSKLYV